MTLQQIAQRLELTLLNPKAPFNPSREVGQAHASDLLSDVLANAPGGGLLLTIQVHLNVIAVAVHAGLAGVVFTSGLAPEEAVREKAAAEGLPLFSTRESTFEVAGKLYALGLRGRHE
jgi:DRTGG domain